MNENSNSDSTYQNLKSMCRYEAETLERVGKPAPRTCGECSHCQKHGIDEVLSKEYGVIFGGYHCKAKIDYSDTNATEYHVVDPDDDYDIEEHGEYNWRTGEKAPCEYFELKIGIPEEPFYEDMFDWLNNQLDVKYTVDSRGKYKSGCVTTGTGGPHIEVDTGKGCVFCYWGGDTATAHVDRRAIARLDEALEELYENMR